MGFKQNFQPILFSMQLFGLIPLGYISSSSSSASSDQPTPNKKGGLSRKKLKNEIPLRCYLYPLFLLVVSWLNVIRNLTLFTNTPLTKAFDYFYVSTIFGYYFMCALIRSSFFIVHWSDNQWLKTVEYLGGETDEATTPSKTPRFKIGGNKNTNNTLPRAHPLAILDKDNDNNRRSRVIIVIHLLCWVYLLGNNALAMYSAYLRRGDYTSTMAPFHSIYKHDILKYKISVIVVGFLGLISDSASAFCNGFICCLTIEFATKFHLLRNWIASREVNQHDDTENNQTPQREEEDEDEVHEEKQTTTEETEPALNDNKEEQASTKSNIRHRFHRNPRLRKYPIFNQNIDPEAEKRRFQLEPLRRAYLYLMICIKKLDQSARPVVAIAILFGCLVVTANMYQMVCSNRDRLVTAAWACRLIIGSCLLFCHILASSHLNKMATGVSESLFQLPNSILFGPENSDDPTAGIHLTLLLGQFGNEPIALTFLGFIPLRNEVVWAIFGALLAYFVILIDQAVGERRGMLSTLSKIKDDTFRPSPSKVTVPLVDRNKKFATIGNASM